MVEPLAAMSILPDCTMHWYGIREEDITMRIEMR
jgi:hypothetical protein